MYQKHDRAEETVGDVEACKTTVASITERREQAA
ncbi:hypothetical protein FHX34_10118 [Actinoplanes teichomyceticus]|uniref:Uncharacterized protein n=1 Tax=Actinoplanes teichomyceticus TaxID=1867 RepID=A0A561WMH7_ACTTI|nr:hypothetical protein FHX34_10118 [Actinoplanes teichomyceticus]